MLRIPEVSFNINDGQHWSMVALRTGLLFVPVLSGRVNSPWFGCNHGLVVIAERLQPLHLVEK